MILDKVEFERLRLFWQCKQYTEFPQTSGIYQIYGDSPVYGIGVLLYIGKADNLNHRIKSHFTSVQSFIGRQPNKSCRFAELDKELLDIAEQTLIVMHKPSFNSSNIIEVSPVLKSRPIYIQNHGDRGMISLEVTNYYFQHTSV